ncbi:MAG: SUMF1/EgtB/PvdO family nonheme iron enzyme [Planctomycetes bacterium]|nr:SUMF1/EgtB/PvdO family nonheme iron enzyme [Planctomycetota bacterium]
MNRLALCVVAALGVAVACWPRAANAEQPSTGPAAEEKTYLLSCAANNAPIDIPVVDRAQVKESLLVDIAGLRLWVDNEESLQRIRARVADPAQASLLVGNYVQKKLHELGVEPDTVPVRGEEGKKMRTEGMIFIPKGDLFPPGATPQGVFQMAGNSAEWCADWYDIAYYNKASAGGVLVDPKGPDAPNASEWYRYRRMFKGWCLPGTADRLTCTKRHARGPLADAAAGISIRCLRSATAEEEAQQGETQPGTKEDKQ